MAVALGRQLAVLWPSHDGTDNDGAGPAGPGPPPARPSVAPRELQAPFVSLTRDPGRHAQGYTLTADHRPGGAAAITTPARRTGGGT